MNRRNLLRIDRRSLLCGAGAAVTLPLLAPATSFAAEGPVPPKRLIFMNFGYGTSESWFPKEAGENLVFTEALKPLERHKEYISVLSNLTNVNGSRRGTHWGSTSFLTSVDIGRTPGRAFHNGVSCDQVAAAHLGKDIRFPFLALTSPDGVSTGYGPGASLSWDFFGNPIQGESDHLRLYYNLFGGDGSSIASRRQSISQKRSVLDAVRSDAKRMERRLGKDDREKVGQYFNLVRNIEDRLSREESWLDRPFPKSPIEKPESKLRGIEGAELMFDLITAAFQTDSTRVVTYRLPVIGLLEDFAAETDKRVGAHPMTHFQSTTSDEYAALVWRDRKLSELLANLLDKLKAARDVDGKTLLDNTLIVMGSDLRTAHIQRNVPIVLAGGGGGGVKQGKHYVYKKDESALASLWLGMLKHSGCPVDQFAGNTEPLTEMFG